MSPTGNTYKQEPSSAPTPEMKTGLVVALLLLAMFVLLSLPAGLVDYSLYTTLDFQYFPTLLARTSPNEPG
jgi:membrane protein insertase Oxa1/YidC/SpoIIIJ